MSQSEVDCISETVSSFPGEVLRPLMRACLEPQVACPAGGGRPHDW